MLVVPLVFPLHFAKNIGLSLCEIKTMQSCPNQVGLYKLLYMFLSAKDRLHSTLLTQLIYLGIRNIPPSNSGK